MRLRSVFVGWIILNAGLVAVAARVDAWCLRYDLVRSEQKLRDLALERKTLLRELAGRRRLDRLKGAAKAWGMPLEVGTTERQYVAPSDGGREAIVWRGGR